jgi:hypothetical protein
MEMLALYAKDHISKELAQDLSEHPGYSLGRHLRACSCNMRHVVVSTSGMLDILDNTILAAPSLSTNGSDLFIGYVKSASQNAHRGISIDTCYDTKTIE